MNDGPPYMCIYFSIPLYGIYLTPFIAVILLLLGLCGPCWTIFANSFESLTACLLYTSLLYLKSFNLEIDNNAFLFMIMY